MKTAEQNENSLAYVIGPWNKTRKSVFYNGFPLLDIVEALGENKTATDSIAYGKWFHDLVDRAMHQAKADTILVSDLSCLSLEMWKHTNYEFYKWKYKMRFAAIEFAGKTVKYMAWL